MQPVTLILNIVLYSVPDLSTLKTHLTGGKFNKNCNELYAGLLF